MRFLSLLCLGAVLLSGCGLLGGAKDLTPLEVAGRYEFTDYTVEPTAASMDSKRLLGAELSRDVSLFLSETGTARLERLRGDRVDETLSEGTYTIRGREVRLVLDNLGDLGRDLLMPRSVSFEADGKRMEADVFLEGVNLEDISDDYRGITRADIRLKISLRKTSG